MIRLDDVTVHTAEHGETYEVQCLECVTETERVALDTRTVLGEEYDTYCEDCGGPTTHRVTAVPGATDGQVFRVPARTTDNDYPEYIVAAHHEDEAVDCVTEVDDVEAVDRLGIETADIDHDGDLPEVKHVH